MKNITPCAFFLFFGSLFFLISCSKQSRFEPSEEAVQKYEQSLGLKGAKTLPQYLEEIPLFHTQGVNLKLSWDYMKKYIQEPPVVYVTEQLSPQMEKEILEGMNTFRQLTRQVNDSFLEEEIKIIVDAFPTASVDGGYMSFWTYFRDGDGSVQGVYHSSNSYDSLINEALYENLRSRVKHLKPTNSKQIVRLMERDIEEYLERNETSLQSFNSKKGDVARVTSMWIKDRLMPYMKDLQELESFVEEVSDPDYKIKKWNSFYDRKGSRIHQFIESNSLFEMSVESRDIVVPVGRRNSLIVGFKVKEWNIYFSEEENSIVNIARVGDGNGAPSISHEPQPIQIDQLSLKVLRKNKFGGETFVHKDQFGAGGEEIIYEAPAAYIINVLNGPSGHQFTLSVDETTIANAIIGQYLPRSLYQDVYVLEKYPEDEWPMGFRRM